MKQSFKTRLFIGIALAACIGTGLALCSKQDMAVNGLGMLCILGAALIAFLNWRMCVTKKGA